jgi:hypothetical protein
MQLQSLTGHASLDDQSANLGKISFHGDQSLTFNWFSSCDGVLVTCLDLFVDLQMDRWFPGPDLPELRQADGRIHMHNPGQVLGVQTLSALLAGATSSVITTPLDVIKTRLQVFPCDAVPHEGWVITASNTTSAHCNHETAASRETPHLGQAMWNAV